MLRITKAADYGIVLLAVMAEHEPGQIHTAREVAERSGLPLPMVSKIMRSLARGAVLTSHRGVTGGYSLDRSANDMTVAEVIRAIDGPISMVQCGVEPGACEQEPVCPTRINWARISREIERALESIQVSEMLTAKDRRELLRIGNDSAQRGVENR